jgi:acetylxylan esterase
MLALFKYDAEPNKLFVTSSSSGCLVTNIVGATYPDMSNASSFYSGFPAGCLAGSPGFSPGSENPACARGESVEPGEEWAELVRGMYHG